MVHEHEHEHEHEHAESRSPVTELPTARLAVLGSPIRHSKSPAIHAAAYAELGLDWSYGREELGAADLAGLLADLGPEWRGLSLTMPLKEEAHRLALVRDPVAEESGVVNTLLRLGVPAPGGGTAWAGFNTDVGGLAAAISKAGLDATSTVVIGSGATAVSAVLAARRLGADHVEIVARNTAAIGDLVARFGDTREPGSDRALHVSGTVMPHTGTLVDAGVLAAQTAADGRVLPPTLVISTVPGPAGAELELPDALLRIPLFDVAYDPWPSPLAERWRAAGGEAHSGDGMLVEQALLQIRIFVAGDPAIPLPDEERLLAVMRDAATPTDMGR
ncbi:shikimate dehydrogenase family protein [Leucobacter chironomi]|uniref:shikimate dehydrogenase family protein n=1 Tax=Leucobacter chironomi TaxID=491918 RepID=UPI001F0B07D2|nr:shikimate dehydrogenase [Leucobacter chironomi]